MAEESIWFRIGYALEQARSASAPSRLRSLADRLPGRTAEKNEPAKAERPGKRQDGSDALGGLLAAGGGVLLARLLDWWRPRRRPGVVGLLKGGAAGAGAALVRELAHPLLHGQLRAPELDGELGEALLAGVARGLLYASIVEPRVPGPALARGVMLGTAEYVVAPWGGLTALAGRRAPHTRIPLVSSLFEGRDADEETFVDHVAFAVALAVLYDLVDDGADQGEAG